MLGWVALQANFYFGLDKIGWKINLHQTGNENEIEPLTSENANVNHTGKILGGGGGIVSSHNSYHAEQGDLHYDRTSVVACY